LFDPQDFLLIYALEPQKIKVLMDTAAQRIKENLISILESGECDIVRFGGAEHATPPLMSPKDFDALVFNYDKPLMDICASYGAKIAVHCHGNIKHALERFSQMGVDQTDPVESAPFGEVTLTQARKITNSKITLTGNIQFSELVNENMEYIKKRVDGIIRKAGKKRLIVTTSATPLEAITQKLYDNYNAMIDAVIDYAD
jgi:uroporphyrinogen-III decarboxylase